ncbi:FliA/WhiG family RNA polymerase sigma factor [Caldibacillus lycopersici]|uniref:FliA/WhiG family RNA polymerase sigma factor n=1 Tax=Perspicuibacillus lycopersici TaxID=1325689 RepID=A0AAE3IPB7_9BACI|nr:FliA/WhiG family RNA polymerase sigma factor [Perspicuibacillus lycopersici]MCU9612080.1 FliA/WhiG family RNA polymerase sigma factor [Perspicuibacillus lycopersici]
MPYITSDEKTRRKNDLTKAEELSLFEQWKNERNDDAANMLVEKYMSLVHIITEKIYKTLPNSIAKEELKSLALVGLYESIDKFDPSRDLKFETYASFRIRGAILDGLRKEDWMPRKTREKAKKLEGTISRLEQKYLRNVTPAEIAAEMGISEEEVYALLDETFYSNILSMDETLDQGESDSQSFVIKDEKIRNPEEELIHSEKIQELAEVISNLSKNEQLVLSLFYKEELTFTEIGQIMERSTSRISQIHSKALATLRSLLKE